jgi:ETC complex I subunit conserved region
MTARIFKPTKTAMQSGTAQTDLWMLVHEASAPREIDPLMGWTSSSDTTSQVKLSFASKDEAIAYAERMGLAYTVNEPEKRSHIRKSYADNFKFGRVGSWTH